MDISFVFLYAFGIFVVAVILCILGYIVGRIFGLGFSESLLAARRKEGKKGK